MSSTVGNEPGHLESVQKVLPKGVITVHRIGDQAQQRNVCVVCDNSYMLRSHCVALYPYIHVANESACLVPNGSLQSTEVLHLVDAVGESELYRSLDIWCQLPSRSFPGMRMANGFCLFKVRKGAVLDCVEPARLHPRAAARGGSTRASASLWSTLRAWMRSVVD